MSPRMRRAQPAKVTIRASAPSRVGQMSHLGGKIQRCYGGYYLVEGWGGWLDVCLRPSPHSLLGGIGRKLIRMVSDWARA